MKRPLSGSTASANTADDVCPRFGSFQCASHSVDKCERMKEQKIQVKAELTKYSELDTFSSSLSDLNQLLDLDIEIHSSLSMTMRRASVFPRLVISTSSARREFLQREQSSSSFALKTDMLKDDGF